MSEMTAELDTPKSAAVADTPLADPEDYFLDGKFDSHRFAKDLVQTYLLVTVQETDEIFSYNGGYYDGGSSGENIVKSWLPGLLRDWFLKVAGHQVRELMDHVRMQSYRPFDVFESNPNLLPVKNGVLDLSDFVLGEYASRKHFFLYQLQVDYDPDADCPAFKKFVSEIVYPDDVALVQEIFGYCLWPEGIASIKKAIMLLGTGNNGKSLLLSVLVRLLGERNVSAIGLANLAENRFASAYLRGKLANIHPDLPDRALRETGQFKALVGDDMISYEIKHGGVGQFTNRAKLIFSTNKLPDAQDDSDAYFARWVVVNFPYEFERGCDEYSDFKRRAVDKNLLKESLTNSRELSGILNWSLEGLRRLRKNGCFTKELSTEKMRDVYTKLANSLKAFVLDDCMVTTRLEDFLSREDFYRAYSQYCRGHKLAPFTKDKVGKSLPSYYPGEITGGRDPVGGKRVWTWRGIRLRGDDESSSDDHQKPIDDFPEAGT